MSSKDMKMRSREYLNMVIAGKKKKKPTGH